MNVGQELGILRLQVLQLQDELEEVYRIIGPAMAKRLGLAKAALRAVKPAQRSGATGAAATSSATEPRTVSFAKPEDAANTEPQLKAGWKSGQVTRAEEVAEVIRCAGRPMTVEEIQRSLADELTRNNLNQVLWKMVRRQQLKRNAYQPFQYSLNPAWRG